MNIDRALVERILATRPCSNGRLEQFLLKPEAAIRQASYLAKRFPSGDVLFVGDDDHISLIYALETSMPAWVIELDSRVANNIRIWVDRLQVSHLRVITTDLRNSIELSGEPAFFYANPPWSSKNGGHGLRYWISRGIDLCAPDCSGVVAMPGNTDIKWVNENWVSVQGFLSRNGCRITELTEDHLRYENINDPRLFSINIRFLRVVSSMRAAEPPQVGDRIYR